MKNLYRILIIGFLIYSCRIVPKLKNGNSFVVERIGIMDSLSVNVSGKVIDLYDKFGLKGVEIELANSKNSYSEHCDVKGEFNFKHISAGKYLIIGHFPGYYMLRDSIELKSGEIVKLKIGLGYDE